MIGSESLCSVCAHESVEHVACCAKGNKGYPLFKPAICVWFLHKNEAKKTGLLVPEKWNLNRMLKKLQAEMCAQAKRCPGALERSGSCTGCLANALPAEFQDWLKQEIDNDTK